MKFDNVYFFTGTAYAGKSTMVKRLAEKYNGIACEENYHDVLVKDLDANEFPALTYLRDMDDWDAFVTRTPDEYLKWVNDTSKEAEILELKILEEVSKENKLVFVDTNISLDTLRKISDKNHVMIMLADPSISVSRFFDRPDSEKQFLYQVLLRQENPEAALLNFREILSRINSKENYDMYEKSEFNIVYKDDNRTIEETMNTISNYFGLE